MESYEEQLVKSINELESQISTREQEIKTLSIKGKGYLQMFLAFLDQDIPWENFSQVWFDLLLIFGTRQQDGSFQAETQGLKWDRECLATEKGKLAKLKKEEEGKIN